MTKDEFMEVVATITPQSATGCMEWPLGRQLSGYGRVRIGGRKVGAHRMAWEMAHGAIRRGMVVRHVVCRNPACVNVAHLAVGTHKDNMLDMVRDRLAGRAPGPSNTRLTPVDVKAIRSSTDSQRVLAKRYGVSQVAVHYIKARKNWAHVE